MSKTTHPTTNPPTNPTINRYRHAKTWATAALLSLVTGSASASTAGQEMPWNTPLEALYNNLSGPLAHMMIAMAVVISGVTWAFTEHGTGGRKVSQIVFGGSVALAAVAFLQNLGFAGALL